MSKKLLILSTGDNHGAYEVAYNIARFMYEAGHSVALAVQHKTKTDPFIVKVQHTVNGSVLKRGIKKIARKLGSGSSTFATEEKYYFLNKDENEKTVAAAFILEKIGFTPDVVIAGMTNGFCTTNTLADLHEQTGAKIYTWLVDMEPLTGGCHYAWDCTGYENNCSNCPAILDASRKNQAQINLLTKKRNIEKAGIRVLSGSEWITNQAKKSWLYRQQQYFFNTHACIDTRVLNGKNRDIAKRVFNIPPDTKIIFTGSWNVHDERKGMSYFLEALAELWSMLDEANRQKVHILVAGEHYGKTSFLNNIPFKKLYIEYIKDYRLLSLAYQAADVFVCASIEDAGPMMVTEALACGTPVVGFKMGNVFSLVENGQNGYVAELKNSHDLAKGLAEVLSLSPEAFTAYSENAIDLVERTSSHHAAVKVLEALFTDD